MILNDIFYILQLQIYEKYLHKYFANTIFIGKQVISLPSCHSTNDITASLVPKGSLFDGAVIVTDHQTAGRGQRGNVWEAAPGQNLTFSIWLKPTFLAIEEQFYLNIITSLAIADFLKDYVNEGVSIKWPNDIYWYDSKLGGILIENTLRQGLIEHVIVGIGLNINQQKFGSDKAISLANICHQEFSLDALLHQLLASIESRYLQLKKGNRKQLLAEYLSKLYWFGEERVFQGKDYFTGEICGIDEIGRLKIKTSAGVRRFDVKEVAFVK